MASESEVTGGPALRRPREWVRSHQDQARRLLQGQGLVLMLVLLCIYFSSRSPYFFTESNFLTIGGTAAALGIMAVAQTYLIIAGGFDVSVGSVVGLTGVVIGLSVEHNESVWLGVFYAVLVGVGVGIVNGFIVVILKVNPLIATLGTLSIFTGLGFTLTGGSTLIVTEANFNYLGSGYVGRVPFPLIVFIVVLALALVVERITAVGRSIYAIGGNIEAARLSGLRVKLVPFVLYVVSGCSAALAGIIITAQLGASSPQVGSTYLLSVVTAVILGGASLAGGRGSVGGTLVAVFILGVLQDGFALLGYSSYVQQMALGVALIVAVLLDQTGKALERR